MSEEQNVASGEFEREPVPAKALLGFKSFVGMYAGEHCAGHRVDDRPVVHCRGSQCV